MFTRILSAQLCYRMVTPGLCVCVCAVCRNLIAFIYSSIDCDYYDYRLDNLKKSVAYERV